MTTLRTNIYSRVRAATLFALWLAVFPIATPEQGVRGRTSVASGGAVDQQLRAAGDPTRAEVRRRLAERGGDTYIGDMLAMRDSSLSRWPDRGGEPLVVWIQDQSSVEGWGESYVEDVRDAFLAWDDLKLPIRFAFTDDSASADVHVTFVHHFEEEISGRTKWARDDAWWITEADIILAVHHRNGPMLDDDAMHAMTLHEVGHLLGLDHTRDSTAVMAPKVRVRSLSRADRATARLLYTLPPGGVK